MNLSEFIAEITPMRRPHASAACVGRNAADYAPTFTDIGYLVCLYFIHKNYGTLAIDDITLIAAASQNILNFSMFASSYVIN